ncbi:hypothetical protein [Actinomadura rudentiformis]|uniref:Uncharacterized protein n=1 Tax=Actinomadura rudentiformis TaxID=359158 RepID=A0A6H9YGU2_9ACTN|nr:hypothetical protein [Actinomadura rudentiformis]KAB2344138.1 hypothetical protein F8566_33045 [Actinomadura rudentiformis]
MSYLIVIDRAAPLMNTGADASWRAEGHVAAAREAMVENRVVEGARAALHQGAQAHGFEAEVWTLELAGLVVKRITGVRAPTSVWWLLTGRLGWNLQALRPARQPAERILAALKPMWPTPPPISTATANRDYGGG